MDNSDIIEKGFQEYFYHLTRISKNFKPKGRNAASGDFRDAVLEIKFPLQNIRKENLSSKDQKLYTLFKTFYESIHKGFENYKNYEAKWWRRSRILVNNLSSMSQMERLAEKIAVAFIPVISGVGIGVITSSIIQSIQETYWAIKKSKLVWKGKHANGWISVAVKEAALNGIKEIETFDFKDECSLTKKIHNIFSSLCFLDTKNHKPWLSAQWQIQFQMICHTWSLKVVSLNEENVIENFQQFATNPKNKFPTKKQNFSYITATWLAYISELIYYSPEKIAKILKSVGFSQTIFFSYYGSEAILAKYSGDKPFIIVAFRGTEPGDYLDILTDAMIIKRKYKNFSIHGGFLTSFESLWGIPRNSGENLKIEGLKGIQYYLSEQENKNIPVYFTGHSLGGALATIASSEYQADATYTFGQPRVGDEKYSEYFSEKKIKFYRVVNNADIVSRIPSEKFNFKHVGEIKQFDRYGGTDEQNISELRPFLSGVKTLLVIVSLSLITLFVFLPHILFLSSFQHHLGFNIETYQIISYCFVPIFLSYWFFKDNIFAFASRFLPRKPLRMFEGNLNSNEQEHNLFKEKSMFEDHSMFSYIFNCQNNIKY